MGETKSKKQMPVGRAVLIAVLAAVVLGAAGVIVGVIATSGTGSTSSASSSTYERSTPKNSTQQLSYEAAMRSGRESAARGTSAQTWASVCRSVSYRIGAEQSDDAQIGYLGGCADSLHDYWGA